VLSDHEQKEALRDAQRDGVWILIPQNSLPERWSDRAVSLALVRLLPEESERLLATGETGPSLQPEEEQLARLAARGMGADEIARTLHMTPRSVYRRLARLRKRFGAATRAELAAVLAKHGF
jgi:DNA-binding NarL/FixJ family response regulator